MDRRYAVVTTTKAWSPRAAVSTWSAETVAKTRMQGRAAAGRGREVRLRRGCCPRRARAWRRVKGEIVMVGDGDGELFGSAGRESQRWRVEKEERVVKRKQNLGRGA